MKLDNLDDLELESLKSGNLDQKLKNSKIQDQENPSSIFEDIYEYLLCRIDQVLPGDEVLSLNEATGALEYSRINTLKDMGVKEVYELTTRSGRIIRTTAEHPYLVLNSNFQNPNSNE